jgi:uncharacterized protein (DUF1800 family)
MASNPSVGPRIARFALDRLGYGPRPESIEEVLDRGVERWALEQLEPGPDGSLDARLGAFPTLSYSVAENLRRYEADPRTLGAHLAELRSARFVRAVHSRNQLEEALVDFWFNHFNVFIGDNLGRYGMARYEQDAIRPHVLGSFRNLLGAVAGSWSMMCYLDNHLSTARNINENYARELMELHTLGVDGGYTQRDVEEVARAFTGWGIDRNGAFLYRNQVHDQRAKTILGQRLPPNQGRKDGDDVLDLLVRHPSTARFVSFKLARRFVSDSPPESVVGRMAETFRRTSGDLSEVMHTLLSSPELWSEAFGPGKVKTPQEYVMSALRAVGAEMTTARRLLDPRRPEGLSTMGMPTYEALDPTGWSDRGLDWIPNPGSHLARMNFALALVSETIEGISVDLRQLVGGADPGDAGAVTDLVDRRIFGETLTPAVRAACARVSSSASLPAALRVVGVALASPAFQVK